MRITWILFLLAIFQSCAQTGKKYAKMETYDQYRSQRIVPRDSAYILYTIKEWSKADWYTFANYTRMYKMTNAQIEFFIGGTFYSPDKKKILIWIGERMPNAATLEIYNKDNPKINKLCPGDQDTVCSMSAMIGVRDSTNQIWKLSPFNQQQAVCYDSKDEVINVLGQYYFGKMKAHEMSRMMQEGPQKGKLVGQAYGYNLQEPDFWSKCWLWQKDTVGSYGLYPFQIQRYNYNDTCEGKCAEPYAPPLINYPDEILKLYK